MTRRACIVLVAVLAAGVVVCASRSPLDAQVLAHNSQALANMRTQAEAGDPLAQYDMAALYHDGRGVSRDGVEAAKWYERAAEQGLVLAQVGLGILYAEGRSLPPDNLTAYMWLSLAAARSGGEAGNRVVERRDAVAAEMTPGQLAEAQRRARDWDSAHPRHR